jgi:hypothetical protein
MCLFNMTQKAQLKFNHRLHEYFHFLAHSRGKITSNMALAKILGRL